VKTRTGAAARIAETMTAEADPTVAEWTAAPTAETRTEGKATAAAKS